MMEEVLGEVVIAHHLEYLRLAIYFRVGDKVYRKGK